MRFTPLLADEIGVGLTATPLYRAPKPASSPETDWKRRWQDLNDAYEVREQMIAVLEARLAGSGDEVTVEACARAAEGPEYWPHPKQPGDVLTYRGTKDGNWLAVKSPCKLDPYSQGRADAAAAVRASLATEKEG